MIYRCNHLLDTFKATAKRNDITYTAVRKQMNQLEDYLGVKFTRRTLGISLTTAEKVLNAENLKLMKDSDSIMKKVQCSQQLKTEPAFNYKADHFSIGKNVHGEQMRAEPAPVFRWRL